MRRHRKHVIQLADHVWNCARRELDEAGKIPKISPEHNRRRARHIIRSLELRALRRAILAQAESEGL